MTRDEQSYVDILVGENKEFKSQIETLRKENYNLETKVNKYEREYQCDVYSPFLYGALMIFIIVVTIKIAKLKY